MNNSVIKTNASGEISSVTRDVMVKHQLKVPNIAAIILLLHS